MTASTRTRVAWVGAAIALLTCAASLTFVFLVGSWSTVDVVLTIAFPLAILVPAVLGVRLTRLVPENGVGVRIVLLGVAFGVLMLGAAMSDWAVTSPARAESVWGGVAVLLDDDCWAFALMALAAVAWVFPDGRSASPAWSRFGRALAWASVALVPVGLWNLDQPLTENGVTLESPLPDAPRWASMLEFVQFMVLLVVLIATVVTVRQRLRRASGIERLQLWWLTYATQLLPVVIVLCVAVGLAVGAEPVVAFGVLVMAPVAMSAAVTIAITRHRLYAIDRLVNRTLVYLVLSVCLALLYGGIAVGLGAFVGGDTPWVVAVATLAVAMAFRPARDAAQRGVDRRFSKRRYAGMRQVEVFLEEVRSGRAEPEQVESVLAEALGDRGLEVRFWLPASERFATVDGRLIDAPGAGDPRAATPVMRGDLLLGLLLHDPELEDRPDTLDGVLRAAGLAMEIARLRVEVRVQLAEVEASRARIVAAGEAERKRLERDLHDGAQQRLVSLGLAIRHAQHLLDSQPEDARASLDSAVDEVTAALEDLREVAHGVRPTLLDAGLGTALADVARRVPVPVDVAVCDDDMSAPVQATAFYVACEAVTNAVKHAGAEQVWVRAERVGSELRVEVRDNGRGGALRTPGGGIDGLADRVASAGGTFDLRSPHGGGTIVLAALPLERGATTP